MAFFIMNVFGKKIFISPLDWGLGHTTRCIPIIRALQELGGDIYIGSNKTQQSLLEHELSNVKYIDFAGYNISYPSKSGMAFKMAVQIPKILIKINKENKQLKKLNKKYNFDLIISDNRFGLYLDKTPSIYITHQINIQAPLGIDKLLHQLHKQFIDNFTQCWIPDNENKTDSLGGQLSHGNIKENYHFIGPLSRFNTPCLSSNIEYEYLAIISGPEPQRTIFKELISNFLKKGGKKAAILGGNPLDDKKTNDVNVDYYPHLTSEQFYNLLNVSKQVICRPGYSSIMDLSALQKPVFFIPTPGQTEQEYLAKYYNKKYNIGFTNQKKMHTKTDALKFNLLPFTTNLTLTKRLKNILDNIID
jgi:uncharacterized protein (TIGR00661 family)